MKLSTFHAKVPIFHVKLSIFSRENLNISREITTLSIRFFEILRGEKGLSSIRIGQQGEIGGTIEVNKTSI